MFAFSIATRSAVTAFLAVVALCGIHPQPAGAEQQAGVGVARLSLVQGEVTVQRGDSNGFASAAVVNTPVLGADYVRTGENARAELQFDGRTLVRLNSGVQLRLLQVETNRRTLQLAVGTIELRVLRGTADRSTIDTPSISLYPLEAGIYRVTVTPEGETDLSVRAGRVAVETPQGTQEIGAGTMLVASGSADAPQTRLHDPLAFDEFDRFNRERDRAQARISASDTYVSRDIEGIDELDDSGRWVDDARYGHLWIPPNADADWSPYRDGRWVWEDGYGWTWVAAEPWGWAPYHYGRWYHSPVYGWAWYPPALGFAPVYSPALVAFFSFGNVSLGLGSIGWVPLAPYEPYTPFGYGYGYGYGTTIVNNVTNVTNVVAATPLPSATLTPTTGNYRNALVRGAVVGVSVTAFRQGRFQHPVAIGGSQLRRATVVSGNVPVAPTTENLRYSMRSVGPQVDLQPAFARSFAGETTPVARVPFDQQRRRAESLVAAPRSTTAPTRSVQAVRPQPAPTQAPTQLPVAPRRIVEPPIVTPRHRPTRETPPPRTIDVAPPVAADPWQRFNASRRTTGATVHEPSSPTRRVLTGPTAVSTPRPARVDPVARPFAPIVRPVIRPSAPAVRPVPPPVQPHVERKADPVRKPGT